ncbi:hypothetical protein OC844_003784 [Tilletia horrida]|nr:hypothetical protein OC844_003784 [Tilletia horrida]
MLITSSILEGSGLEDGDEDDIPSNLKGCTDPPISDTPSLSPLPLPLRAHARFRTAFNRMRNQMLITSRMVETGAMDQSSSGPLVVRPRSPLAGGRSARSMSIQSAASMDEHEMATSQSVASESSASDTKPYFDLSRPRCLSISVAGGSLLIDDHNSSSATSMTSEEERHRRRNSLAGIPQLPLHHTGIQAGMRSRRTSSADPANSLETHLRDELRRLVDATGSIDGSDRSAGMQQHVSAASAAGSLLPASLTAAYISFTPSMPDRQHCAQVQATVNSYLENVPPVLATSEGWNLCLESLYACQAYDIPAAIHTTPFTAGTASDATSHSVQSVYDFMLAAGAQPTGRTYSVLVQSLCAQAAQQLQQRQQDGGDVKMIESEEDKCSAAAAIALLERALALLRTAVLQHPGHGTHPDAPTPFVRLLEGFAAHASPRRVEEVIELWSKSATEAGLHSIDGRAHFALIQAVVNAAERGTTHGQDPAMTHLGAVQKVTECLQTFEQDCKEGILERQSLGSHGRVAYDLLVYNGAIEASFRLGYPDRGVEIFERILSHQQMPTHYLSQVPVDASTISVLLEGLLLVGEPATAVQWLLKLRQHNKLVKLLNADVTPAELATKMLPEPNDTIVSQILAELLKAFPTVHGPSVASTELEAALQGFLDLLPVIRERAETSPAFLPPNLATRISEILDSAHRSKMQPISPRTAAQAQAQARAPARAPAPAPAPMPAMAPAVPMSQPMTPAITQDSSCSTQHSSAHEPLSPPMTPLLPVPAAQRSPIPGTASVTAAGPQQQHPAIRSLDPSFLTALNVTPAHPLPRLRKIDAALSRKLEAALRIKKPRSGTSGGGSAGGADHSPTASVQAPLAMLRKQAGNGCYPDAVAFKELIMACGRANDLGLVREVYSLAAVMLAHMERGSEAQLRAWYSIEDAVLSALAHSGDAGGANAHRRRLLSAGGVPSANSYAALIATVKDTTDDAQAARDLWHESRQLGVVPNIYLYNAIISKLSRARKAYPALQLFDEMRRPPHNLQPTSVTYGAIVNACVRGGDAQRATKYFAEMEADPSFKARVPPYNTMIQFFTYAEPNREQALLYYHKMQAAGVSPSAHTYKLLLDIYGTVAPVQPTEMERIFAQLRKDSNVQVNGAHWASLIQCYGMELKNVSKAIEIFERADAEAGGSSGHSSNSGPTAADPIALEALMLVFFEAHQPHLMRRYVEAMRRRRPQGTRMTAYICNLLIKGYALDGISGLCEARAIFAQMRDPPAGVAAAGNHAPRVHGAGSRRPSTSPSSSAAAAANASSSAHAATRQNQRRKGGPTPTPALSHADGEHDQQQAATAALGATSFDQVFREPSTYESMIRAELSHGFVEPARHILAQMESRGFPPALISRTRTLFDEDVQNVLTVCLKPAPREAAAPGGGGGAEMTHGHSAHGSVQVHAHGHGRAYTQAGARPVYHHA